MTSLVVCVEQVHDCLDRHSIRHAFGGALAMAQYTDPRATMDIDVNVFVPVASASEVLAVLGTIGLEPETDPDRWRPISGLRLRWPDEAYPVDVFPSVDDAYELIAGRTELHPFGTADKPTPFLSAQDLAMFKLSFGRDKDWVDLRAIAAARPDIDVDAIEELLIGLRGPSMHPRVARFRAMIREVRVRAARPG